MLFCSICYCTIYNSLLHAYSIHVYERAGLGRISEAVSARQYAYVYAHTPYSLLDIKFNGHQKLIIFSAYYSSDTLSFTTFWVMYLYWIVPARVITKWCQPLRSYKNAKKKQRGILSILSGRIQFLERYLPTVRKILVRDVCGKRQPTEMEFDHELHRWLKSKKSRRTHLDTRVCAYYMYALITRMPNPCTMYTGTSAA